MRNRKSFLVLLLLVVLVLIAIWLIQKQYRSQFTEKNTSPPTEPVETRLGPSEIYPDRERTPGAANPDITQENIRDTICNPRWSTRKVRPPVGYTNHLKIEQIGEYQYADTSIKDYEEDHLIPLELGGHPRDPKNLWPEPYRTSLPEGGARSKDKVENYLHVQVCAGSLTLEEAQHEIADDWYRVYMTSVPH